jgi:chromosome segregation ATPase
MADLLVAASSADPESRTREFVRTLEIFQNDAQQLRLANSESQNEVLRLESQSQSLQQRIDVLTADLNSSRAEIEQLRARRPSHISDDMDNPRRRLSRLSDASDDSRQHPSPASHDLIISMATCSPAFFSPSLQMSFPLEHDVLFQPHYSRTQPDEVFSRAPRRWTGTIESPLGETHRPDEAEEVAFRARQEALSNELAKVQLIAAENAQARDVAVADLAHMNEVMAKLRARIDELEGQLRGLRDHFNAQLPVVRLEADHFRVSYKQEVDGMEAVRVRAEAVGQKDDGDEQREIAERFQRLSLENSQLLAKFDDANASNRIWERRLVQLQKEYKALEEEKERLEEKVKDGARQERILEHAGAVKQQLNELQDKYDELQVKYKELARTKATRFDPLMMQRSPRRERANDPEATAKLRQQEARMEMLRVRCEEMQLLLGKANATNQRLNQLISRKEAQLAHSNEQVAILKQELALHRTSGD